MESCQTVLLALCSTVCVQEKKKCKLRFCVHPIWDRHWVWSQIVLCVVLCRTVTTEPREGLPRADLHSAAQ